MSSFGENLKRIRIYNGISQRALAKAMNRTINSISNWERNVSCPDLIAIMELCDYFKVTPNELLGYEENPEVTNFFKKQEEMYTELEKLYQVQNTINERIERYTKELGAFNMPKNIRKKIDK